MQLLSSLFGANDFMPHGYCIRWTPDLVQLYVVSDSLIALAYFSIPFFLAYFVWRRKDLKYKWLFQLFSAFILSCGITHVLSIASLWYPIYWLDASMKAVTAAVSVVTALMMIWVIPKALKLPGPAQLEKEVQVRREAYEEVFKVKEQLREVNQSLEVRVSERTRDLERQKSLYAVLSECNQFIVRCTSEEELFPHICSNAVQFGNMKMAWVGLISSDTRMVQPVASFGDGTEFLQGIEISIDAASPFGCGPTAISIREDLPYWCQDYMHDPATIPWRERAACVGNWGASASLPLHREGIVIGTFNLYSSEINAFDEDACDLLVEMAKDISFSLDNFTRENARKRAEEAQSKSEARYRAVAQSANDAIITADNSGNIVNWNHSAEIIFGYSEAEILGQQLTMLMPQGYKNLHTTGMHRVLSGGEPHIIGKTVELEGLHKNGSEFPLELSLATWETAEGRFFTGFIHDITKRKKEQEELRHERDRAQSYLDTVETIIVALNADGKITTINRKGCQILGWEADELIGQFWFSTCLLQPDGMESVYPYFLMLIKGEVEQLEYHENYVVTQSGELRQIAWHNNLLRDVQGTIVGILSAGEDITERKLAEQSLRMSEERYTMTLAAVNDGLWDWHIPSGNAFFSGHYYTLLGYENGEFPATYDSWRLLVHPEDIERVERELGTSISSGKGFTIDLRMRKKTGEWLWVSTRGKTVELDTDGKALRMVGTLSDITVRKQAEDKIHYLAFFDPLTALPNRRLLHDRLQHTLTASARHKTHGAVLFIDLDDFKRLNDTKGHNIGDLLLIEVAKRLQTCVREGDTVARLGGDEFVVILEGLSEEALQAAAQTETVCDKILPAISQPYLLKGYEYYCSASLGISLFFGQEITVDELLKRADTAMYQAKNSGRNTMRFYDPTMQATLEYRTALESDLRVALAKKQFRLYYQMQVDHSGHIVGAEALIRWQHPERGLVMPLEFIELAEETGLILPIGLWVLETACEQLDVWQTDPLAGNLQLSVNVSARQFRHPDFVDQVSRVLHGYALNPGRLKLELTESLILDDVDDTIVKMQALREIGVRFSMDDFGTGYSSLSYLTKLPLSQLKIDQSFVRNIGTQSTDAVIVQTIIGMANNLGMEVIAEGVETEQQRAFLEQHGCPLCQGYLFGKPMPIAEFETRLKKS